MSLKSDQRYTVLTIEDEISVRKSIKAHLEDYNYRVLEADNGEEGINMFRSEKPDVVLVDLKMPGIHGLEVIKTISSSSEMTPVIVVSGSGEIQSAISAMHNGASDYVLKPVADLKILNRSIDKCIRKSREKKQEQLYRWHLENELLLKSEEIERKNYLLSQLNRNLDNIIDSAFSLSQKRRLSDLGAHMLENFAQHLDAAGGSLYIRESKGLRLMHSIGPAHTPEFIPFPLNIKSVFSKVLNTCKPILVDNLDSEEGLKPSGWDGYRDSSCMIFPLPDSDGKVSGIISLHNKNNPPFISEDREIGLLMSIFYKEAYRTMKSIDAVHLSQSRFKNLSENSEAVIFSYNIETRSFDFVNSAFWKLTGKDRERVADRGLKTFVETMGIVEKEDFISHFENMITGINSGGGLEYRITTSSGRHKRVFQKTVVIFNLDGIPVTIDGIITEYSEQKEVEEQIKELLEQKGVLLNEINHRVKNNMQIISSLINLQLEMHEDEKSRNSLIAAESRITSMALVHDNIYDSDFSPAIDMSGYIRGLVSNIVDSRTTPQNIDVSLDVPQISMDLDRALLCGLIVNEAVSNAMVHAFPGDTGGSVSLKLLADNDYYDLVISDNGVGFSLSENIGRTGGIGVDIIRSLVIQLDGALDFVINGGTTVAVRFPLINSSARKEQR